MNLNPPPGYLNNRELEGREQSPGAVSLLEGYEQWQIPPAGPHFASPVVSTVGSEYHSADEFRNRTHRTLIQSLTTCALALHASHNVGSVPSAGAPGDTVPIGVDTIPAGILGPACRAAMRQASLEPTMIFGAFVHNIAAAERRA